MGLFDIFKKNGQANKQLINITWFSNNYQLNDHSDYENGQLIVCIECDADKPSRINFDEDGNSIKVNWNKYGMIDLDQNIIIPLEYDYISSFGKYGLAIVTRPSKGVGVNDFIDINNNIIISSDDFFIPYTELVENEYIKVATLEMEGRKYGFVNSLGKVVIPLEYRDLKEINNGFIIAQKDKYYGIIDIQNKIIVDFKYDHIRFGDKFLYTVTLNKKKGVIDCNGNEIIPIKYDSVCLYWEDNLLTVKKDGKYGVFNSKGEQIVEFIYDDIKTYNCDGYLSVCKNEKWGLLDKDGNLVVPLEFEATSFAKNGVSEVQISKRKKGYYSIKEQKLISNFTDALFGFEKGLTPIKNKGKWGAIDENGVEVIPCQYKDGFYFSDDGMAMVVNADLKCGYIDKQNNTVIPFEYDWIVDCGNIILVTIGYSPFWSHVFNGVKKGLIDRKGNIILPVIYDEIYLRENNTILVKKGKKSGFVIIDNN